MEKNTDTGAKAIAETKKEEIIKEEYNNENGEAKIIEVSYNINRFCPFETLTRGTTERNLICLMV